MYRCSLRCQGLFVLALISVLTLVGCSSVPSASQSARSGTFSTATPPKAASPQLPVLPRAGSGRGGYYLDDGPGDNPPEGLLDLPDPEPQVEPYSTRGNKPYTVFGKTYTPITDERPFTQRGVGSWYGKKFHGQKTSSGELYDMYKMTAAHPTLPIPSYARVTNLVNGKQIIVRVNDRGPFHSGRIIDLSYTAALKLGYLGKGSGELEVERLLPEDIARLANSKKEQLARTQSLPTPEVLAAAAAVESSPHTEPGPAPLTTGAGDSAKAQPVISSAPPVSTETSAPGFYLQLGTYAQAENAETARSRLAQNKAIILPPVAMVEYGLFYRLYSGPFGSRAEALAAAQRLQEDGVFKPLVVQR